MMKKFLFFIMLLVFLIYIVSKNNLIFAQTLKIEYVGNVLSSASDVAILGDYAYVSRGFDGLSIVDISDPENPLALGTVSKSNCRFDAVGIREATAYSTQSYYICRPNSSLEAVDVTNPLNPILYPPENVYGIGAAVEMDISDHYAYLTLNGGGLWIYDLANPTNPELRGIYNPGSHSVFEDVKVINGIAYIADLNGYFFVVDVTNPVNPITLDYTTFYANPLGVAVKGDFAYLAAGGPGLIVVDVSDKNNIETIGSYNTFLYARDVEVSGNYAFVSGNEGSVHGIEVIDISNPSSPIEVDFYQAQHGVGRMTLKPPYIFQAGGNSGLVILRFDGLLPQPSGPEPFLGLPWDYEGKGMSFSEAALAINSYFDHEYPLLSTSLLEPNPAVNSIITFENEKSASKPYSTHDGYDYGRDAGTKNGEPILAAASGCASYAYSGAGGNEILIDHGNGYQTRYYHLQSQDLITKSSSCVQVAKGQQIGRVGFTGNVSPKGESGSHLHFMVVQDKDDNGNFDDNIPDGITDPFGWQSEESDPWPIYTFNYQGVNHTGIKSYYLWTDAIANISKTITSNAAFFELEKFKFDFPQGATDENLKLNIEYAPPAKPSNTLESLGSTISITARDLYGNLVIDFQKAFNLVITYDPVMVFRYKPETMKIYTSSDGVNWTEVDNTVIDEVSYKASAQVDHLSYFALMAERKDTNPPVTVANLSGEEGQDNWYKGDVLLSLNASDGEDGLGVDYTAFKFADKDWEEYKDPIKFDDEGSYKVEFYSSDLDENIEEVKAVEFNIDKTSPEINLSVDPVIIWPPDGKMTDIKVWGSANDNVEIKNLVLSVEDEYNEISKLIPLTKDFDAIIQLEARRKGDDLDGRKYLIKVTAFDLAGNNASSELAVLVPHDQRNK